MSPIQVLARTASRRLLLIVLLTLWIVLPAPWSLAQSDGGGTTLARPGGGRGTPWKFLRLPVDARGVALGEGFVALTEGTASPYWNPAGMVFSDDGLGAGEQGTNDRIKALGLTVMALRGSGLELISPRGELESAAPTHVYASVVRPQQLGSMRMAFGFSLNRLQMPGVHEMDSSGNLLGDVMYSTWSASSAVAAKIVHAGQDQEGSSVSLGTALRLSGGTYSKRGIGADIGFLWRLMRFPIVGRARVGYSMTTLFPSAGNGRVTRWRWGISTDMAAGPASIRPVIGIGHETGEPPAFSIGTEIAFIPLAGLNGQRAVRLRAALNGLKAGARQTPAYLRDDLASPMMTFGLGILYTTFSFDWAMVVGTDLSNQQMASITIEM